MGGLIFYLQQNSIGRINANAWAIFPLTGLIAVCLGLQSAVERQKGRLVLLSLAVVNFAWIFLSGSRGTLLVSLCCLVFLFLSTRNLSINTVFLAGLMAGSLWLSFSFAEQEVYALSRIERLFDPNSTLESRTSGRSIIAEAGWLIFLENPLGIGTGGFQEQAAGFELFRGKEWQAHSAWVKTLAENGIPGVILLTAFLLSFTIQGLHSSYKNERLLGLLTTTVFAIAFLSKEFQGKALWLLAAGALVLLQRNEFLRYLRDPTKAWKSLMYQRFGRKQV